MIVTTFARICLLALQTGILHNYLFQSTLTHTLTQLIHLACALLMDHVSFPN